MPRQVYCPNCWASMSVSEDRFKRGLRCPDCGKPISSGQSDPPRPRRGRDADLPPRTTGHRAATGKSQRQTRAGEGSWIVFILTGGVLFLATAAWTAYVLIRHKPAQAVAEAGPGVIADVKRSTVYIRCDHGLGRISSGTGFFAGRPGYVLTKCHVIGYHPREFMPAHKIEVFVGSGEADEKSYIARVYGVDGDADLALLFIDQLDKSEPLTFGSAEQLNETEEVLIFGYPFGEQLGKNISVNKSTVSSLRRENGKVASFSFPAG